MSHLPIESGADPQGHELRPSMPAAGLAPATEFSAEMMREFEAPASSGGTTWRRYIAAVLRYKWLVAGITIVGSAAGYGVTRFFSPLFEANGTVWIEQPIRSAARPISSGQLFDSFAWIELLKAFEIMEYTAREHRLWITGDEDAESLIANLDLTDSVLTGQYEIEVSPDGREVTLTGARGRYTEHASPGDSLGGRAGFLWRPSPEFLTPGLRAKFQVATPRAAARQLQASLRGRLDREGQFMQISLSGNDRENLASHLNTIMERYIEFAGEVKREKLTELSRILEQQLNAARQNLQRAENALESFRVRTITLPSEPASPIAPGLQITQSSAMQNFFSMKTEQDQLRQDREALRRVLADLSTNGLSIDAIEVNRTAMGSSELNQIVVALTSARAELRALLNRYTEENPQVIRLQEQIEQIERVDLPSQLQALLAQLDARDAQLSARIASAGRDLQEIPQRRIEEDRLNREVVIADRLFTDLDNRYQQAILAEVSSIPDVRILDRASTPQRPSSNDAPRIMAMAIFGSLALAVGAALFLDRVDSRVRYPEQITEGLGLPIIGAIPRVGGGRKKAKGAGMDQVIEALRGIRLNLVHSYSGNGPLLLTITSPGGGDGKSFTASNLALAFAEAGHRTLLIDGDVRRGQLHRLFDTQRKPGLTELLTGERPREEVIRDTEFPALHFIPCGTRTHTAPELLGSAAMSQLLNSCRASYSVIIVDSPPMSAGIDPFALGALTGHLMLVIRTGTTDKDLAGAKLDTLDRLPIKVLGAVLNDIRPGGGGGYYYGYYSYYLPGYTAEDEDLPSEEAARNVLEHSTGK